ncbi:MAG: hypothetical protein AAFY46_09910 [Planctomycetota bacterium]
MTKTPENNDRIQDLEADLAEWLGVQGDALTPFAAAADRYLPYFVRELAGPLERMLAALDPLHGALQLFRRLNDRRELPEGSAEAEDLIDTLALDLCEAKYCFPDQVLVVWARYLSLPRAQQDAIEALGASV